jgi:hypothetical protein
MPREPRLKGNEVRSLPLEEDESTEYDDGFQSGSEGKPCSSSSPEWLRGWADAQE